jgi:hypothetical protein
MKKLQLTMALFFVIVVTLQAQETLSESVRTTRRDLAKKMTEASNDVASVTAFFEGSTFIIKYSVKQTDWDKSMGQLFAELLVRSILDGLTDQEKTTIKFKTKIEFIEIRVYAHNRTLLGKVLVPFK